MFVAEKVLLLLVISLTVHGDIMTWISFPKDRPFRSGFPSIAFKKCRQCGRLSSSLLLELTSFSTNKRVSGDLWQLNDNMTPLYVIMKPTSTDQHSDENFFRNFVRLFCWKESNSLFSLLLAGLFSPSDSALYHQPRTVYWEGQCLFPLLIDYHGFSRDTLALLSRY